MADTILKDMLITRVSNRTAAGTTAISSTVLDMQGFDSVMFLAVIQDSTSGSVFSLAIKSNPTSSSSGGTVEVQGDTMTDPDGTTYDNTLLAVECFRPTQRYVFAYMSRATQNVAVDGIVAIQFNAKNKPQTQTILDAVFAGPNA